MTAVPAVFDPAASVQLTQTRIYLGGPRALIAQSVQQQGWAINLSGYTTLADTLMGSAESAEIAGGTYNSFPTLGGAFYALGDDGGDNWFTYQNRRGTILIGIARVSDSTSQFIPTTLPGGAPNPLQLWRDASAFLTKGGYGWKLQDSGFGWQLSLSGRKWNSAIVFQEAAVRVYQRFWNGTYRQWSDYTPVFHGYFDPIKVSAGYQQNEFTASATGLSKYLKSVTIQGQVFGCEPIQAIYTSSGILTNPDLAPGEGRPPVSFAEANLGDTDNLTVSVLKDVPVPGPPLDKPLGVPQANPEIPKRNYLKIQQVACAARGGPTITSQEQLWIEVVNGSPADPPSRWPWVDDPGTPSESPKLPDGTPNPNYRQPTKAALTADDWQTLKGKGIALGELVLEAYPSGTRLYVDSSIILGPQANVIFCHDKTLYEQNFRVPLGTTIIETKSLDGWCPGMWLEERRHGLGSTFTLDPAGGGFLLRGGNSKSENLVRSDGNQYANSLILADTTTPANNGTAAATLTLEAGKGASFPVQGQGDVETVGVTLRWNGKSGDTLLNVEKGGWKGERYGWSIPGGIVNKRLNAAFFKGWYHDAVFWGAVSPPPRFLYETDTASNPQGPILGGNGEPTGGNYPSNDADLGKDRDQNLDTFINQVWGNRTNPTSILTFTTPGAPAFPAGIPENYAIRRTHWAGGAAANRSGDGISGDPFPQAFSGYDGGTADDWQLLSTPLPGNPNGVNAICWWMLQMPVHPAASVILDDTDVPHSDGFGTYYNKTIQVNENGAWEYPPQLTGREYLVAIESGIAFLYGSRDRSTFYDCQKLDANGKLIPWGSGPTIAAGQTLYRMVDLNPDWRASERGPLSPRNLLQVAGLSWDHKKASATATVLFHDVAGAHTVEVGPNQAGRFAQSGQFTVRTPAGDAVMTYSYSSRNVGLFSGVAFVSVDPAGTTGIDGGYQIHPGSIITGVANGANWPLNWSIHASRRDLPIPFNTNYGRNADWQEIVGAGHSDGPANVIPVVSRQTVSQWKWVVLVVWETSDQGHAALGSLIPWRQAKTDQGRVGFKQMLMGGYSYGSIVNEILDQAGVAEEDRDIDLTGPLVRSLEVSQGNAWQILNDLAKNAGYIIGETALGQIRWFPDPRRPGASYPGHPKHTFDETNVFGTVQREELPYSAVDQVHLIATNNYAQEVYDVVVPPQPIRYGGAPKTIQGRFATSEQDAVDQALAELARGNGGQRLRIPGGHYTDILPLDFVRVALPLDVAGQEIDATMLATGGQWTFDVGGMTSVIETSTFRK